MYSTGTSTTWGGNKQTTKKYALCTEVLPTQLAKYRQGLLLRTSWERALLVRRLHAQLATLAAARDVRVHLRDRMIPRTTLNPTSYGDAQDT